MHATDEAEDEADSEDELAEHAEPKHAEPSVCFYPMPIGKLVLFGLIGGHWFCLYWSYRCWLAYRAAWGYSKADFWRAAHRATGYRISPFWRAALVGFYAYALFPAVQRECRQHSVAGTGAPIALAFLFSFLAVLQFQEDTWVRVFCTPVWALLPIQHAINRLNAQVGHRVRHRTTLAEGLFLALGAWATFAPLANWGR